MNQISSDYTIDIVGITKNYQEITALKDVTFNWTKGVLGLVGPNGSGKSTLIKILCTVIRANKGSARILGKDIVKDSLEVRRRIGVLFENPVFHPNLRVFQSLCWVGELRGVTSNYAKRQVRELLEYFQLDNTLNYQLRELSAGMRQKYGLIFATLDSPPLILLDEPTSNLDPDARNLYESYIKRLVKENDCSFLISSHVLTELDRICDGFVFLFQGLVSKAGKREDFKIPGQRFRIIAKNPRKLVPTLINAGIEIESLEQTEIIVKEGTFKTLMELDSLRGEIINIIPLESEIEGIYRQLRDQHRKQGETR